MKGQRGQPGQPDQPGRPVQPRSRPRCTRLRRALLAALVMTSVIAPLSAAAAHPQIPAPAPARIGPVTPTTLDSAYAANRANAAEASRMAADHGDRSRAAAVRSMAAPSRHFLSFDARGSGHAVEVFGDLAKAAHLAVLVPGSDTSLDTYDRFRTGALALHERLGPRAAVIAWLGYETPGTISPEVLTTSRANEAAPELRSFIGELRALNGRARITLLCHSYGTAVGARAASGLDISDLVFIGSPGTGVDSAAALHTRARVWAGRGGDDWIADVPHTRTDLFGTTVGFGTDPVSPAFGARVFAAGDGGHSDYLKPGSVSLANLARIVLGETREVTRG
ncbi:alpha/beta hydrolase [Streptomyces sp. NBC_00878]|uniref:alpha/beta hydrolase n=1 Tax=Streptomyces sp. NBC_00878 TaxID=2975854 RepID=UPI0022543BC0|nr:alpha/beta hydrolase [Streptomyces sp. NBC_00878]MCX4907570.1 alpha/beta hydrolase family protein [Streptomyces sp. NBC_00878]